MSCTASSGSVNCTAMGSIWLMTTSPLVSAACTMLPGSTSRAPARPFMGEAMRVKLSCTSAYCTCAASFCTAASSWLTSAFCVSTCCCVAASWPSSVV
jgi:hypothetical protein